MEPRPHSSSVRAKTGLLSVRRFPEIPLKVLEFTWGISSIETLEKGQINV